MTFVLVPGAWLGAWCWDEVVALLREAGRDAIALSLSGLAERAHLLTPEIGLKAHVSDVVTLLRDRDISDAVLVGHSYGGTVITAAADEVPERVRWLAYLDAAVPRDGESNDDVVGLRWQRACAIARYAPAIRAMCHRLRSRIGSCRRIFVGGSRVGSRHTRFAASQSRFGCVLRWPRHSGAPICAPLGNPSSMAG
jgi:pimeloyl-ACP methyl ester carboxylesterase